MRKMFSKNQIKEIAVEGVNAGISSGEVTFPITEYPMVTDNRFVEGTYAKCVKDNNILWIVIAGSIPQQDANIGAIVFATCELPDNILAKLHTIPTGDGVESDVYTFSVCTYQHGGSYYDTPIRVRLNNGLLAVNGNIAQGSSNNINFISIRVPLILD